MRNRLRLLRLLIIEIRRGIKEYRDAGCTAETSFAAGLPAGCYRFSMAMGEHWTRLLNEINRSKQTEDGAVPTEPQADSEEKENG